MRTARAWGVRPTEFFGGWSPRDRGLALALAMHEQSICGCGCGQPVHVSHDADTDGWYNVESTVCYARQALEREREQRGDDEPGTMLYVTLDEDYEGRTGD